MIDPYEDFDFADIQEEMEACLKIPNYMQPLIDAQIIEITYFNQTPFVGLLTAKKERKYAYSIDQQ